MAIRLASRGGMRSGGRMQTSSSPVRVVGVVLCAFAMGLLMATVAGATEARAVVTLGNEVLAAEGFKMLAGKRVGLITNPSGVNRKLETTLEVLRAESVEDRLVIFARAVSLPDEHIRVVPLASAHPDMADMRTLVIVGSPSTRLIARPGAGAYVYTPRSAR